MTGFISYAADAGPKLLDDLEEGVKIQSCKIKSRAMCISSTSWPNSLIFLAYFQVISVQHLEIAKTKPKHLQE